MPETVDEQNEKHQDWVEHLEELRRRLFVIIGALGAASVICYFFSGPLFHLLTSPIRPFQEKLYFLSPYEAFLVKLQIAFFAGILVSSPVVAFQLWRFVAPGLYDREKKTVLLSVGWTAACFLAGVLFCFYAVVPFALKFFLGFQTEDLRPLISIKQYFSFLLSFLLGFGLAFVFPVFLLALVKLGVLRAETLSRQRRVAVVVIFILAAVITPSPDVASQLLLAVPLLALFEVSVFLAKRMEKGGPSA